MQYLLWLNSVTWVPWGSGNANQPLTPHIPSHTWAGISLLWPLPLTYEQKPCRPRHQTSQAGAGYSGGHAAFPQSFGDLQHHLKSDLWPSAFSDASLSPSTLLSVSLLLSSELAHKAWDLVIHKREACSINLDLGRDGKPFKNVSLSVGVWIGRGSTEGRKERRKRGRKGGALHTHRRQPGCCGIKVFGTEKVTCFKIKWRECVPFSTHPPHVYQSAISHQQITYKVGPRGAEVTKPEAR